MLVAWVLSLIHEPFLRRLEKRGVSRTKATLITYGISGILTSTLGIIGIEVLIDQWSSFRSELPIIISRIIQQVGGLEHKLHAWLTFLPKFQFIDSLKKSLQDGDLISFRTLPSILGSALTTLLLAPILSIFWSLRSDSILARIRTLAPKRHQATLTTLQVRIGSSVSDYVQAKILEALIVGLLATGGLWIVDVPYAIVYGFFIGLTNILPYLGPLLGAIPPLVVLGIDPTLSTLFIPALLVLIITNAIDMFFIFPIFVARLINLHPLLLIAAVTLGGNHYGMIGMLLSIPVLAATNVIALEIYRFLYLSPSTDESSLYNE